MSFKTKALYEPVYDLLANRARVLSAIADKKKSDLEKMPYGGLRASKRKAGYQYYIIKNKNDTNGHYAGKKDAKMIKAYAQKEYDKLFLKYATRECNAIYQLLEIVSCGKERNPNTYLADVFATLPESRKSLVEPVVYDEETVIKKWMEKPFLANPRPFDNNPFITLKNEYVRSMSEKLLADTMFKLNLPYKYEAQLILGDQIIYPDFTIFDYVNMREVYFEHFGMMDNKEYAEKAIKKIQLYEEHGIFLGDQLIVTFGTSNIRVNQQNFIKMLKAKFSI